MRDLTVSLQSRKDVAERAPDERWRGLAGWLAGKYNRAHELFRSPTAAHTSWQELAEVRQFAIAPTDINEHLERIFIETVLFRPALIVELGVRGGASTYVFDRAARLSDAYLVSIDISNCSHVCNNDKWHFIQGDDIAVGREFLNLCASRNIGSRPDVLFVDTSHYFDHTVEEIRTWFPLLAPRVKVIFHDTNLRTIGPRHDGRFELSWDNQRGVIRAIEDFLNINIDERRECTAHASGWLVRHWANCNGLTILDRLS
jgi:cephalosporin hydroxylase